MFFCLIFMLGQPSAAAEYVCGDANDDGSVNIGDAVYMVNYIFHDGPPPPPGCCADCENGETRPCYTGPPETEGVGQCTAGIQTCVLAVWGECVGVILPQIEECDGEDNDCDGAVDEGLAPMPCALQEGVCAGSVRPCGGAGGWEPCGPADYGSDYESVETRCDGLDNDCDGEVDEGFGNLGEPCWVGEGECARQGYYICDPTGSGTICSAEAGLPVAESCDGLDNDCDGVIDNGFNLGDPCTVGVGECLSVGYTVCDPSGTGVECSATAGSPTTEVCDGLDNDCNGQIDEGFSELGDPCWVGQGECARQGYYICDPTGSGVICSVAPGSPTSEICDGLDNDCDGIIDNGYDVGAPCSEGIGTCTNYGTKVCTVDGTGTECSVSAGAPTSELCDGLDNDCDGVIDNGFDVGAPCSEGVGECTNYGTKVCKVDGTGTECSVSAGAPTSESCDGLDNDCDGVIDNGFNVGDPCSVGVGACTVYGTYVCDPSGSGTICNAVAGTPTTEICGDGIDNDCDGLTDSEDPDCP